MEPAVSRLLDRGRADSSSGARPVSIEHELDDDEEEIEFQLKWPVEPHSEIESEGESLV
jgi:hypothetical protein